LRLRLFVGTGVFGRTADPPGGSRMSWRRTPAATAFRVAQVAGLVAGMDAGLTGAGPIDGASLAATCRGPPRPDHGVGGTEARRSDRSM